MEVRYIFPVLLIVVLIVVGILRLRQAPEVVRQMQRDDGDDPLKRWARGCYSISWGPTPELDGVSDCREVLASSWDISSAEEVFATITRLSAVPTGCVAWDLVRVVMCARLASGAGFISMDQFRVTVGNLQRRLQDQYGGWEEMAADYDAAASERGFGEAHRIQHRPAARQIWAVVPFR